MQVCDGQPALHDSSVGVLCSLRAPPYEKEDAEALLSKHP